MAKNNPQLFTSNRDDYETPQQFWERLDREFRFTCDMAADAKNAKTETYIDKAINALSIPWDEPGMERGWINPPFGRGNVLKNWFRKVVVEYERRKRDHIVVLSASRTETVWFQRLIWDHADEVRFVQGRLQFELQGEPIRGKDGKPMGATFPAVVSIFRRKPLYRGGLGMPKFARMLSKVPGDPDIVAQLVGAGTPECF